MDRFLPWIDNLHLARIVLTALASGFLWMVLARWMVRRWPATVRTELAHATMEVMGWRYWLWQGLAFGFYMLLFFLLVELSDHYGAGTETVALFLAIGLTPSFLLGRIVAAQARLFEGARAMPRNGDT
ncbi:MAG: hypothetical protein GC150_13170 [Rhizobiales bacterium]|nr:hypothetical protein [Hyphomicrobiales bacterium]